MHLLIALLLSLSPVSATPTVTPSCRKAPAGVRITVPGFPDRPAFLQRAGKRSPLIVAFHGLHGCPAYLQTQTKLGAAAKKAVVLSSVLILVCDFFMAKIFVVFRG